MGIIGRLKSYVEKRDTDRFMKKANELENLKAQRVKEEGRLKVEQLYAKEKSDIQKAKNERLEIKKQEFKSKFEGIRLALSSLKTEPERKENIRKSKKIKRRNNYRPREEEKKDTNPWRNMGNF